MIQYWENPARTVKEMRSRPEFARVFHTTLDKNLGILAGTELYTANLLLLTDLLCHDPETIKYAKHHVRYLSHLSWGIPDFRADPSNGVALVDQDMSKTHTMKFWFVMKVVNALATAVLKNDEVVADAVYDRVCVMKTSSDVSITKDLTMKETLAMKTTYGRLMRKALDPTTVDQAHLKDMRDVSGAFVEG